ncbi:MAG: hypothetical protein HND43_07110 [Armatimonadetes bacterium]|nr:hypothetical protein [Armatimonadota bacterium]NOG39148.1 hypothetical protein [Armatimonadota bacterium]
MSLHSLCSRAVISASAELATETFLLGGFGFTVVRTPDLPYNSRKRLVEVKKDYRAGCAPELVAWEQYDVVQRILSSIALIGVCEAMLDSWAATTYTCVRPDQKFWVLTPANVVRESPVGISLKASLSTDAFERIRTNAQTATLIMDGLRAESVVDQFRGLVLALERLVESDCSDFQPSKCPKCGHKWDSDRKAIWKHIKKVLGEFDVAPNLVDQARKLRGKISHGSVPTSLAEFSEFAGVQAKLFGPTMALALEEYGITAKTNERMLVQSPFIRYDLQYLGTGNLRVCGLEFKSAAACAKIPRNANVDHGGSSMLGVEFDPGGIPKLEHIHLPRFEDGDFDIQWENTVRDILRADGD